LQKTIVADMLELSGVGRLPNSFDGRYYGPVRETDVVGMFRPVWTD
jgi:type IV secretory pathway protease TraF